MRATAKLVTAKLVTAKLVTAKLVTAKLVTAMLVTAMLVPGVLRASGVAAERFPTDSLVEDVACRNDPTQTYTLYLPPGYNADRTWPVLLIFDPRGRSVLAAELFVDAARDFGWILMSSDNTRSDTTWEPNRKALAAMWPEVHLRFDTHPQRIYATGFSGGAIVAYYLGLTSGGLAGVIGAGGRWPEAIPSERLSFVHFGFAGNTDFNYSEMRKIDAVYAERQVAHRLEIFDGPHGWMPAALAREGVEWMEILALRAGLRDRDPALVEEVFTKDVGRAADLEAGGRVLEALRRYRAVRRTFDGLRDLGEVEKRVTALKSDPRVAEAEMEERRWDSFAASYEANKLPVLNLLRDPNLALVSQRLLAQLNAPSLLKQAEKETYEGVVARRLLNTIYTQSGFYLPRELASHGRFRDAVVALEIAVAVGQGGWPPWYNMACYAARGGQKKQALRALERAIELGFDDLDWMSRDSDLDSLRRTATYSQLAARLSGG